MSDTLLFLRSLLRNPTRTGAVVPSGRALANLITAGLGATDKPIIELGPGTGTFTQALLARGIPEHRLVLVEANPAFARMLRKRFPRARVLEMDAARLADFPALVDEPAGAVVSGLPLLSTPADSVAAILKGAFSHLHQDGALYQFTYMPKCPVPDRVLADLAIQARRYGVAWANLPPAFVYRLRRAPRKV